MKPVIHYCEQGSEEWLALRCGKPTASEFSKVLAKGQGKTRASYLYTVVAERLSGQPGDGYSNRDFDRGHEMEPEARSHYAFVSDNTVDQVGFIENGIAGYSPDGLIGAGGLLEIKSGLSHIVARALAEDRIPTEHTPQLQGGLWVSGRAWIDFVLYCPGLPIFIKRAEPDPEYIATLEREVRLFVSEVDQVVAKITGRRADRPPLRDALAGSLAEASA